MRTQQGRRRCLGGQEGNPEGICEKVPTKTRRKEVW